MFGFNIRNYEKEFVTDTLESHHVFYDLYVKSDDPQELRNEVSESMTDLDYKILLNEMSKFEDTELEETFRGGNAKPIRVLVKSAKDNVKGSKYPLLWKACLVLAIVLLVTILASYSGTWWNGLTTFSTQPSAVLLYSTIALFVLAFLFLVIREVVPIFLWAKIIGIYDPTEESANVRIVLAGECQFKDKDSYSKLENDMTELYSELSRKYANKLNKRQMSSSVSAAFSVGTRGAQNLTSKLKEAEKESADLERNFVAGKISEDQYKELKEKIEARKAQLDTLFDLLNG
jgi:GH24 family phage-related lysozyme (muramidase)